MSFTSVSNPLLVAEDEVKDFGLSTINSPDVTIYMQMFTVQ